MENSKHPFVSRVAFSGCVAMAVSLIAFAVSGCQHAGSKNPPMTLDSNPDAPKDAIQKFYGTEQWNYVKNLKYDAFVILRGYVSSNYTIPNARIIKSFPDTTRDALAREFSKDIRLTPVTVGGRIRAAAEIYVYFYESGLNPRQALVIAKQQSSIGPTASVGGDLYLITVTY